MKIIKNTTDLQAQCLKWREQGLTVGLVPTMGFFHAGHLSLMEQARSQCDRLVVTLFVNPTQFGPDEDLDAYPRDLDRDARLANEQGADVLFTPDPDAMYAPDHSTWVEVPELAKGLCGATRPIHFRGVCTVVMKLFMLTQPAIAVFGQKDWQQLAILKRMVRDLNIPVTIKGMPIVREKDGLALSSRNAYLTKEERALAPNLHAGLVQAAKLAASGNNNAGEIREFIRSFYEKNIPGGEIDYIEIVDAENMSPVENIDEAALVAVAVRLGKARLIDNQYIEV